MRNLFLSLLLVFFAVSCLSTNTDSSGGDDSGGDDSGGDNSGGDNSGGGDGKTLRERIGKYETFGEDPKATLTVAVDEITVGRSLRFIISSPLTSSQLDSTETSFTFPNATIFDSRAGSSTEGKYHNANLNVSFYDNPSDGIIAYISFYSPTAGDWRDTYSFYTRK